MKVIQLFLVFGIILGAGYAGANRLPSDPAEPTGCVSHPGDPPPPDPSFDVRVISNRSWGVVPFEVRFGISIPTGIDSLTGAAWDFNGDGITDTTGLSVSHTFTEADDFAVAARIETVVHGLVTQSVVIAGYSALMSLTFDDGQESLHSVAFPLLSSKGVTATAYIVPTWIGGWYVTWDDLQEMKQAGWDIGSHSLTHANPAGLDSAALDYELKESQAELRARGFPAKHFAVPFGACSWRVIAAVKQYYESCRGWIGMNPRLEATDPYLLKWDVTMHWKAFGDYKQMMDSVMTYGGWYILNSHMVEPNCGGQNLCVDAPMLSQIIDYAHENRIKILSIDEALAARRPGPNPVIVPRGSGPDTHSLALAVGRTCVSTFPVNISFSATRDVPLDLAIYDVAGRMVRDLARVDHGPAEHSIVWDGQTAAGTEVVSGFYFCVLRAGDSARLTRKIVVTR